MEFDKTMKDDTTMQSGLISKQLNDFTEQEKIKYINAFNTFKKENDPMKLYFKNDYHFAVYGHRVFAKCLLEYLKDEIK